MGADEKLTQWHRLTTQQSLEHTRAELKGLSEQEAQTRLQQQGANEIPQQQQRGLWKILVAQFSDFMIIVLLAAAVISGVLGDPADTIAILVIILLNAAIGIVQELRAERAVAALREMSAPVAHVRRAGQSMDIAADELVTGDIVLLEAGNIIPADLRLLECEELQADESSLTGESQTVSKQSEALGEPDIPLGDRSNLAFKGTVITRGRGSGVVVATGLATEIGKIAQLLQNDADVKTPLQIRLTRFGKYLALSVLAICAIVFVAGLLQGQPWLLMFMTAVSLAVAAIPEALPAVVAISLALGAHRLIQHHTLVRNLPAVETLGSVTYICSDKTGTLTENRMSVELFCTASGETKALTPPGDGGVLRELGYALALSNDIDGTGTKASGEPTELALYQAAYQHAYLKHELETLLPRKAVISFDSKRKQMTTLHQTDDGTLAYSKGAPEVIIAQCSQVETDAGPKPCDESFWLDKASQLANQGYRVLALAKREFHHNINTLTSEAIENQLSLLGLVALIDPPREEAGQAIQDCLSAGITPVMITGDHPGTAMAIAQRLAIATRPDQLISGSELAELSDEEFIQRVKSIRVYARVSPQQKLSIVKALQQHHEFVAMTGDGVNDAPALQNANIGVAMGNKGTDVAREASDMVLLDDNFASIVQAVRTGRRIFDNIRKFIKYTMTSNSGEIWTLFLAPLLGLPIPLLPIHILWINLVTDGLPGLAFSAEPAEKDLMRRAPRSPKENIFAHGMWQHIVWVGLLIGGLSVAILAWSISQQLPHWQTMVFTVLTVSQLFQCLAVRGESASLFSQGLFSNLPMIGAILLTVLLQLAIIYLPVFQQIFNTQALPLTDLLLCFAVSSIVLIAGEFEKLLIRRGVIYRASNPINA